MESILLSGIFYISRLDQLFLKEIIEFMKQFKIDIRIIDFKDKDYLYNNEF
ncbi:MAG: hypothetical protein QXW35_00760 [Candidatus Aenigmatarchaeota archaeon]